MDERGNGPLEEVRAEIDAVDRRIVELIAERQRLVLRAGSLKADRDAVRAPNRVEHVIRKVRVLAARTGASPDIVESAYRGLIAGFIDLELEHVEAR